MLKEYIEERLSRTSFGQAYQKTKRMVKRNKPLVYISFAITMLLSWKISGILFRPWSLTHLTVFLILSLVMEFAAIKIALSVYKPYVIEQEEDRRINVSDTGEAGTARFMDKKEEDATFDKGNIYHIKGNIVGGNRKEDDLSTAELYSIHEQYGINANALYVGAPGSGKTRCLAVTNIFQTIRRGESMIVTDPKGELYEKTAKMAVAHGYTVKILNLNPDEIIHSDSFDYMSVINSDIKAAVFANTIIENTSDGTEDLHWKSQALNFLKCLVIAVNTYYKELKVEKRLSSVYTLITSYSLQKFESEMSKIVKVESPAYNYLRAFMNGESKVKESVYGSMGVRLSIFNDPIVQEITGTEDIDITLPGREKCLYFVSMSDQEHSMNFLIALFFALFFQENVSYANSLPGKCLPVKTWLLLDEFFSMGKINDFPAKLSNVRSRGINCTIIIQDITQLQQMYPDNLWQTVVNCCSSVILLQAGAAPETAKFFSDRTGDMTVVSSNIRHGDSPLKVVKSIDSMMTSETKTARKVMTPDEVQTMDIRDALVIVATRHVIKLRKYDYMNHPMAQEMVSTLSCNHLPNWYINMSERERMLKGIGEITNGEILTADGVVLCEENDFKHPKTGKQMQRELKMKGFKDFLLESMPFDLYEYEEEEGSVTFSSAPGSDEDGEYTPPSAADFDE